MTSFRPFPMSPLALRSLAGAALTAALSLSCGSNGSPAPSAFIISTLGQQEIENPGSCSVTEPGAPFYTVGTPNSTGTAGTAIVNGSPCNDSCYPASQASTPVTVSCQVSSAGANTYSVNLVVNQGELNGITLGGTLNDTPGTSQGPFTVNFSSLSGGNYSENDCTVILSTMGTPPITAGRIWGTLSCPNMKDPEDNYVCAATATFIFQNCQE